MSPQEMKPYPGLRPFEAEDKEFFFGRETQIDELFQRLADHHFVAVVGDSASGKSSLVKAGLIPHLGNGFPHPEGELWQTLTFEPGRTPIRELAGRLSALYRKTGSDPGVGFLERVLRMSDRGLVECARGMLRHEALDNLLIVVDQFEEVFPVDRSNRENLIADSSILVDLLLRAVEQEDVRVYVLLTMRSSFLGHCQAFPGLPEMMNKAQFLVPRMNREELRLAITAPARVKGKGVASSLVEFLLNEVGKTLASDPDQLPVLQHALARTWDAWQARPGHGETIEYDPDYASTGGLNGALDRHAQQLFDTLSERQQKIAIKLFQTITIERADMEWSRRPTSVAEIVEIARGLPDLESVTDREVFEVVDSFRRQCNFLRPYTKVEPDLQPGSRINISHESLMRKWQTMRAWIGEEHRAAHTFREVADVAQKYSDESPEHAVWQNPDWKAASARLDGHGWDEAWAAQYGSADEYKQARKFIDRYREESEKISRHLLLKKFLEQWTQVSLSHEPEQIYQAACKIAVDLLGADRSTFVSIEEGAVFGTVVAEETRCDLPEAIAAHHAIGMKIPLDDPYELKLIAERKPIACFDVEKEVEEGVFKRNLRSLSVKSVLIVPVIGRSLVGSLSLDSVLEHKYFDADALELCNLLAAQIAAALDNARALEEGRHRTDLLQKLVEFRLDFRPRGGDGELHFEILLGALDLCGWSAGAIYRYALEDRSLRCVGFHHRRQLGWKPAVLSMFEGSGWWLSQVAEGDAMYRDLGVEGDPAAVPQDTMLRGFHRAVAIKLKSFDTVDSILLLLDDEPTRPFARIDVDYLVEFANRTAGQLERQEVWDSVWNKLNLEFLHLLGPGPTTDAELRQRLHTFLTMVTANFGLRFNRAIVFLLNEQRDALIPRMAIGQLSQQEWETACKSDSREGRDTFEGWRHAAGGGWLPTPLEKWAAEGTPLSLNNVADPLAHTVETAGRCVLSSESELRCLPDSIFRLLNPGSRVILEPLHTGLEIIGLVMVDREFTREEIPQRDLLALQVFCKQVAIAIRDYVRPSHILGAMQPLFKEINTGSDDRTFDQREEIDVLGEIADRTLKAFSAGAVCLILRDSSGQVREQVIRGNVTIPGRLLRSDGPSMRVMDTGLAEIHESLESSEWGPAIKVGRCLPFSSGNRTIGVIWILYQSILGVRRVDTATLQQFAAEASLIYAYWQHVRNLSAQRRALQEIAGAESFESAAGKMVEHTHEIFKAKTVTFWPYDMRQGNFAHLKMIRKGFDEELPIPERGGMTYRILEGRDHVLIDDVGKYEGSKPLGAKTIRFLQKNGIKAVEGIAIYAGEDPLGVLFVDYAAVTRFGLAEVRMLVDWAASVATVLHTVQLLDAERQARKAAEEAAGYLARGSLELTLKKLAEGALKTLRCGTVTIHQYDDEKGKPLFPPVMEGVNDPDRLKREDEPDANRLIPALIQRPEPITVARNRSELEPFESRFIRCENIHASIAIRLEFATRHVGLMFFSYRNELQESALTPVLGLAGLFAKHAAVAIGSSQRTDELTKLSAALLAEGSKIMDLALKSVMKHLRPDRCNIVIQEETQLRSVAQIGWGSEHLELIEEDSHAGFTVSQQRPIAFSSIDKIKEDPLLNGFRPPKRLTEAGIRSGLAVPIIREGKATGAILVHMREEHEFSTEDINFLALVANQVMMAYRSALRVRTIEAENAAAKVIATADFENETAMLKTIRDLIGNYLVDEKGESKVRAVWIALRGDALAPPDHANFSQPIFLDKDPVGAILVRTRDDRTLTTVDTEILKGIAELTGIGLGQAREHRDSMIKMASLATGFYVELDRVRTRITELLNSPLGRSMDQLGALSSVGFDLEMLEKHSQAIAYTVWALCEPVDPDRKRVPANRIGDLVRNICQQEKPGADRRKVKLLAPVLELSEREVEVDEIMISAVFSNLIENAIEYNVPAGSITCRTYENDWGVTFEVQDLGLGLRKEQQEGIFTAFDRAFATNLRKGVKIGLAFCRKVIHLHRGHIAAFSDGPGKGSTFVVTLPWAPESAPDPAGAGALTTPES